MHYAPSPSASPSPSPSPYSPVWQLALTSAHLHRLQARPAGPDWPCSRTQGSRLLPKLRPLCRGRTSCLEIAEEPAPLINNNISTPRKHENQRFKRRKRRQRRTRQRGFNTERDQVENSVMLIPGADLDFNMSRFSVLAVFTAPLYAPYMAALANMHSPAQAPSWPRRLRLPA